MNRPTDRLFRGLGLAALLLPVVLGVGFVILGGAPASVDGVPEARADAPVAPAPPPTPMSIPAPGGMVYVPSDGDVQIGTSAMQILELTKGRPEISLELSYETARHKVKLRPYFIDLHEVSNAQYATFLDQTAKTTYTTGSSALSNLAEVGSFFVYGDPQRYKTEPSDVTWRQLYWLNKDALEAALPAAVKAQAKEGIRAFRLEVLPPDVTLTVYRRRLPDHWFEESGVLEGAGAPNLPVRSVSYLDLLAMAEWAGKHVPTEEEFEYAMRGPEGRVYPWGDEFVDGYEPEGGKKRIEKRCNWAGLGLLDKRFRPQLMDIDSLPEGRSWVGCHHGIGNVAEWTSSWFTAYPGYIEPPAKMGKDGKPEPNRYASYVGDYVKVIRGGSVADQERVVLRNAFRNFAGAGRIGPPVPDARYEFTGGRLASYLRPGLSRLEAAVLPLLPPKRLRAEHLALDRFAGAIATHWTPTGAAAKDGVYVTGPSSVILVEPVAMLSTDPKEKPYAKTPADVLAKANEEEPVILGAFRTDIPLEKVAVLDTAAPTTPRRKTGRAKPEAPKTKEGTLAPDSYVLGIHHGLLGFYRANLDFVAFLPAPPKVEAKKLGKVDGKPEEPPASSLLVEPDADLVKVSFWVAYGGKGTEPGEGVVISFSLTPQSGLLDKAGNWRDQ